MAEGFRPPEGFARLDLRPNGFIDTNGPLYAKREPGRLVLGAPVEARHCNFAGICHGGWLGTLADLLIGLAANAQARLWRFLPTVSLSCDYLKPAQQGDWVEGRADILRTTRNLCFVQGLLSVAGEPVLRCHGLLKIGGEVDPRFILKGFEDL